MRTFRIPITSSYGGAALAFALLLLSAQAGAAVVNVPADQPTIQAGINAAADGDTVNVAPGTYNEAIVISSRNNLTVQGSGFTVTTILAPGQGPAIRVDRSSGIDITGFRLSSQAGGGDNYDIGAIRIFESDGIRIFRNLITNHAANGIVLYGSDIEVFNNDIVKVGDDGIRLEGNNSNAGNTALIYNNTIADNRGGSGVGIWLGRSNDSATVFNNILFNNDYNIGLQSTSPFAHDFNLISTPRTNFYGPVSRNVNEPDCDPLFVNPALVDYHLPIGSCAEDMGTASFASYAAAADDKEGDLRPQGGGFELGADEIAVDPLICEPLSQGYWHRQCLGVPASEGGIDPGRYGRGPSSPTEPGFVDEHMPCAEARLEDLGFYGIATCEGMDADPPSDECERALKQLTALVLNVCSGHLSDACEVDASEDGCSATTVGGLIDEVANLIHGGHCQQGSSCAAAVNEGEALVGDDGLLETSFSSQGDGDGSRLSPPEGSLSEGADSGVTDDRRSRGTRARRVPRVQIRVQETPRVGPSLEEEGPEKR